MASEDPRIEELLASASVLLASVTADDLDALTRLLVPGGPAQVAVELFGPDAVALPIGLHIPGEVVHGRQVRLGEREAELELVRPVPAAEPREHCCTLTLRHYRGRWRLWSLLPVPLDKSLFDDLVFDSLLADLLDGAEQLDLEPEGPRDEVESLVLASMRARGFNFLEQTNAVRIWRDFVKKARLLLDRPRTWAAAVEYVIVLMEFRKGSQGEVGGYYGVSAGTVAARYKAIADTLALHQYDQRYSLHRMPLYHESLALGVRPRYLRMPLGAGRGKSFFAPR
jgi:hypothetical protein